MSSRKRRRESDAPVPAPAAAESDERVCWVCLEPHVRATRSGARELARCGCACRGSGAGWAHLPCLIRAAQHQPAMWDECPTCKHEYSGSMMLNLARTRARLAEEAFDAAPLEAMWITREGRPVVTREHETEEELSASMSMLANVLIGRGGYAEARRILERLVARDAERWGADDSVTLHSQCGLVQALLDMGDFAAARPKADQLVATCVERLGSTDGTTLDAQAVRAQVLEMVGEEAQARRLWEEIVATRLAQDGPTGEETVVAKHMHADMLHSCGHAAAARALYEEVLAAYTQTVGPAHEDTLNLEGTLAELQVALGLDLPAAEQTLRRIIEGLTEIRGADDPWVLALRSSLGLAWQKQGRCADAEAVWLEVLHKLEARADQSQAVHATRSRLHALRQGKVVGYPEPRWRPGMANE